MCNEQTGLNYQATLENQNKIIDLEKQLHDREMLIDEMERRLQVLEARIESIKRENDLTEFTGSYSGGLEDL